MTSKLFSHITLTVPEGAWPRFEPQDLQTATLLVVFVVLAFAEARWAYLDMPKNVTRRSYLANVGTLIVNDTLLSLLSISALLGLAEHDSGMGLLDGIDDPVTKGVVAFVLLDLALFLWHWACHKVDWLWRFHRIHHSDPCMNVSTAFRTHIVEVLLTVLVKAVFIVLTGIDKLTLLLSEVLITVATIVHHANLRFPGESWLGRLTIVPYLHRVHHSAKRQEHDSNYGAFFSVWDRLFGTLKECEPARLGLAQAGEHSVIGLFLYGFEPLDAQPAPAAPASGVSVAKMIAEAAYYRAEKRGFRPGFEFHDWLEAEKDILNHLRRSSG